MLKKYWSPFFPASYSLYQRMIINFQEENFWTLEKIKLEYPFYHWMKKHLPETSKLFFHLLIGNVINEKYFFFYII